MDILFLGPKQINSSSDESKELSVKFPGIVLEKNSAIDVWEGECRKIKLSKKYQKALGKNLYYMDKAYCYGILKIGKSLKKNVYEIEIVDKFETPKPVESSDSSLVDDIKFLQVTTEPSVRGVAIGGSGLQPIWIWGKKKKDGKEVKLPTIEVIKLIEDVKAYDPEKPDNKQLADDWKIVLGWYATHKEMEGKGTKFSKETIVNLAKLIYNEIKKRIKERGMKHEFEETKPTAQELYKIVSNTGILSDWKNLNLDGLDDFSIVKDCVSLIGSSKLNDNINVLIKMEKPSEFFKKAIEIRLSKMFPENLQDKMQFIWEEKEGPHESLIPLFDMQFKRIRPVKMITMVQDKSSKIQLMKPHTPQKPLGSAHYDLDKFMEILT